MLLKRCVLTAHELSSKLESGKTNTMRKMSDHRTNKFLIHNLIRK